MSKKYVCYVIYSGTHTYTGITNNIDNRLQKHNAHKGAKSTKSRGDWEIYVVVGYFNDRSTAQRFEWFAKHVQTSVGTWKRTPSGLHNKLNRIKYLLSLPEFINVGII